MGFFRRRQQSADDDFEPPPGMDVPDGMAAVPVEKIVDWAAKLASKASEMAVSKEAPDFVDLAAKVGLPQICGEARSVGFPGGTHILGFNLFLLGYWCRTAEMRPLATAEVSAQVTGYLELAHEQELWGDDWFATLCGASTMIAGLGAEKSGDLAGAFRTALPDGLGEDFRRYYAATAVAGMCDAIEAQSPGALDPLEPGEMNACWRVGYWMRAVSVSLPDEAHSEFASR